MGLSLISSDTLISALAMPRRFASDTSEARRPVEAQFLDAVVDQHLHVVDLQNLSPEVGEHRKVQVAVRNGRFIRAFRPGALRVHVNPLVVERGVGEKVDLLLRDRQVVGNTQLLTYVLGEFVEIVDD